MEKRRLQYAHNEARIYRRYYRPQTNPFYLLKSLLCIFFSGDSPYGRSTYTEKHKHFLK